jgi:hypothetical protein
MDRKFNNSCHGNRSKTTRNLPLMSKVDQNIDIFEGIQNDAFIPEIDVLNFALEGEY